jgi:acetyl-CoA C-acetyltransferase
MTEVVIVSGARTAIGTFGASLRDVPVVDLGALVIKEALTRAGLRPTSSEKLLQYAPQTLAGTGLVDLEKQYYHWDHSLTEVQVDEVIMGHVIQAGQGQNTARQAMMRAGVPKETNAFTVNKVCASGLKAITLGTQAILLGEAEVVVAGGMENMSQAPYALPKARWGYRMDITGAGEAADLMVHDGLWEIFYGYHMGLTAENIAQKYHITREEQDELGLLSERARPLLRVSLSRRSCLCSSLSARATLWYSTQTSGRWTPAWRRWPSSGQLSARMEPSLRATLQGSTMPPQRWSSCPERRRRNSASTRS